MCNFISNNRKRKSAYHHINEQINHQEVIIPINQPKYLYEFLSKLLKVRYYPIKYTANITQGWARFSAH